MNQSQRKTFTRETVTPGKYLYARPDWKSPIPATVIKTPFDELAVEFRKGFNPVRIENIFADAIFTPVDESEKS